MTQHLSTAATVHRAHPARRGLVLALALCLCAGLMPDRGLLAASSAASSALESSGTSIGLSSDAISGVSASSSPGGKKVTQGDYRIERTQALDEGPARVALDLRPEPQAAAQGAQAWQLRLPLALATQHDLQPGQIVRVRTRDYGLALLRPGAEQAFYLVVDDAWARALQAQPLGDRPAPPPAL